MHDPLSFSTNSALKISFYFRLLLVQVPLPAWKPDGQAEHCNYCIAPEILAKFEDTRDNLEKVACEEGCKESRQDQLDRGQTL